MVVPQVHAVLDARHAMDVQIAEELPALMLLANAPDAQMHVEEVPVVMDAFHHAPIAVSMVVLRVALGLVRLVMMMIMIKLYQLCHHVPVHVLVKHALVVAL